MRDELIARPLHALVIAPTDLMIQAPPRPSGCLIQLRVRRWLKTLSDFFSAKRDNAGLQLRRAISIQAEGNEVT